MGTLLSFLKTATTEDVKPARGGGGGGLKKPWNPPDTLLAIRVWKDGAIFPSQALIDRFSLEYHSVYITKGDLIEDTPEYIAKFNEANEKLVAEGKPAKALKARYKPSKYESLDGVFGNGFDVIDSRIWRGYMGSGNMLFITPTSKDEAKVDLFASTKYDESTEAGTGKIIGTPISKVFDQGSKTYGEATLLPAIKELYGIELTDDKQYVDMLLIDELQVDADTTIDFNKQFSKDIIYAPKVVDRGVDKGKPDYVRREKAIIWGFIPYDVLNPSTEQSTITDQGSDQTQTDETLLP